MRSEFFLKPMHAHIAKVTGYIERHPELQHFAAVIVVTMALEEAYPCD